jgi:hypothetical protein
MKKLIYIPILICSLLFIGCEKNEDLPEKDPGNYQTPLPAATTTGANIFACYVDGKAYIANKNAMTAYHEYYQGRYGISIRGKWEESKFIGAITLRSNTAEEVQEGMTYQLGKVQPTSSNIDYYAGSVFFRNFGDSGTLVSTDEIQKGELTVTHYDKFDAILSGTFWFDIKQPDGNIIQIRDGRFDVTYN